MPRLPSYKKRQASADREVRVLTFAELGGDPKRYGLNGSPTQVERIYPPEPKSVRHTICGDAKETAEGLFSTLKELKFI